jgi:hypothetical protein
MLPLNASHAYLLAAIAEQIPEPPHRTKATVEPKRDSFTFAAIAHDELQLDDSSLQIDHGCLRNLRSGSNYSSIALASM